MKRIQVMVICTGNSCRSQMADGWLRFYFRDKAKIYSAGIRADGVNEKAVRVMEEAGIDISRHISNKLSEFEKMKFDVLITVCDHANENCPYFPGVFRRYHQNFLDPSNQDGGGVEDLEIYRMVRDEIKDFCQRIYDEISSLEYLSSR